MAHIYAPILKFKEGEIKGYGKLESYEKEKIFPIFDLIDNISKEKICEKLVKNGIQNIGLDIFKSIGNASSFFNELTSLMLQNSINLFPIIILKVQLII